MVSWKDGFTESKGRFLVNTTLMFGSVIAQIQFSLIIKKRIGSPKHSLTPHPLTSDFPFIPHPFPKWTSYMYHPKSFTSGRNFFWNKIFMTSYGFSVALWNKRHILKYLAQFEITFWMISRGFLRFEKPWNSCKLFKSSFCRLLVTNLS